MNYAKFTKNELIDMLVKQSRPQINGNTEVTKYIMQYMKPFTVSEVEQFAVLILDGAHKVIGHDIVSKGLVNRTLVHPREVFRPAIIANATAIIIIHNHPSGNLEPSIEDRNVTRRLKDAGDLLGIQVLDHVIVSGIGASSMLANSTF